MSCLKKTKDVNYVFNISIPLCLFSKKEKEELISGGKVLTCCHVAKGSGLVLDPEGKVLSCNHFPEFPLGVFGLDFKDKETFYEFWQNLEPVRDFARRLPHHQCENCQDWTICGGGCYVRWLAYEPVDFIERR